MPSSFLLERPRSPAEALEILAGADDTRVLAGGQSLVPLLSLGLAFPEVVVSLDRCEDLTDIRIEPDEVVIDAMVTTRRVELDDEISSLLPLLGVAAGHVGSPHVRNLGTVTGNLCHADPGSDLIPAAICLDATVDVGSSTGTRRVPVRDLIEGPFTTTLGPGEMAIATRVPTLEGSWGHGYRKVTRRAGDLAQATVAVLLRLDESRISDARVVVGGAVRRAARITMLEGALAGATVAEAVDVALESGWIEHHEADLLPEPTLPLDYLTLMLPRLVAATVADALEVGR